MATTLHGSIWLFYVVAVDETLDSILDESGDEEEQEAVVNQVLDEIGIEVAGRVRASAVFFVSLHVFFVNSQTCIKQPVY